MDIFKDEYSNMITVRMADYKVASGSQKLITRDLGSCIGITIRDARTGIGGLLHAMLPTTIIRKDIPKEQLPKYVDLGLERMIAEIERADADIQGNANGKIVLFDFAIKITILIKK